MGSDDAARRVADRIKARLEDLGMTGRAFARQMGHRDSWISHLLAYKFALSLEQLDKAAYVLKLAPGELVREAEEAWDLTPTEMRVVRSLRMLPPAVRDHVVILADYLVGVTPDEVELLKKIRHLEAEDLMKFDHWIDVTLLRLHREQGSEARSGPATTSAPPAAPIRRTGTRRTR